MKCQKFQAENCEGLLFMLGEFYLNISPLMGEGQGEGEGDQK
jgi:hypothetical protein